MKKLIALSVALMMMVLFAACGGTQTSSAPADSTANTANSTSAAAKDSYTIALSVPRISNPFFGRAVNILEVYATSLGNIELLVLDAEDSSPTQMEQIETMISRNVDGVIMAPVDSAALVPAAEALEKAGIPLVTVDRALESGAVLTHVGSDNVIGAELAAQYIVDNIGEENTKVVNMIGTPGALPTTLRKEGFDNVMAEHKNVTVIEQSANYVRSEGMDVMDNILQANPDVKAVFTGNEEMGLGVIEALQARGYAPGDVIVVAFDTHLETLAALESGWLQGNVEQFPDEQFRTGLDLMLSYLKDGTEPSESVTFLTPELITVDNISDSEKYEDYRTENG